MVFQHDNDPAHVVKYWLNKEGIECLTWPPCSSDLNPIECLWDELERRMKKHHPKNENELRHAFQAEWKGIGRNVTKNLLNQFQIAYTNVYRMKGHSTRY